MIKCPKCKKEWCYKGKKKANKNYPVYVCCPVCHTSIKLVG